MRKSLLKWISFSMAVIAICTLSCSAEETLPFGDVSESDWYYESVQKAYNEGIVKGTSDNQFDSDGVITREMFLTMLGRAVDIDPSVYEDDSNSFSDVSSDQWYSPYINWGVKTGIVKGIGDSEFGIGQSVTREQMAVFLSRCINSECGVSLKVSESDFVEFKDKDEISDWAADSLDLMQLCDVFTGDDNDYFHPQKIASRAEGTVVVMRLIDVFEGNAKTISAFDEASSIVLQRVDVIDRELPVSVTLSDENTVEEIISYIQNATVLTRKKIPDSTGWTYWISLYDSDGKYIAGYRFEPNYIVIDNILIETDEDYFQPLIDRIK